MATPVLEGQNPAYSTESVVMRPPGKLNLSLVVFDSRSDGYHDLHTVMATFNLHDELHLKISHEPGIHLYCTGLLSPAGRQNLVYQAAELLARRVNIKPALDIFLNKRIPAGAGLGGASSDAAAALMGLNRLWSLNLPLKELELIGAEVGSDVPFFFHSPVALCTGRGEIVTELPHRPKRAILLILPKIHISTAEVYQKYICDKIIVEDNMRIIRYFLRQGDLDGLITQGINSLIGTTMTLCEPLSKLRCQLEEMGIRPVHMAGSGSGLFTTSNSSEQLTQWAQEIRKHRLGQAIEARFHNHQESFPEVHHADI